MLEQTLFPKERIELFRECLLAWYDANARDLPWRKNRDPYHVWVSEIMLQQTRVAAVIEHYHEFLRRFPIVEKLAAARESSVLAAWSGLGYYRRARMLHAAAKVIAGERNGKFPTLAAEWKMLPGIGRYTAAAVASIAFGEPVGVVDGNVERVIERVSGNGFSNSQIWKFAELLLDRRRPGDFNQAMMELGATVCTPRTPTCLTCPIVDFCATRGERADGSKARRQHKREIHYALESRNGAVFLVQRPRNDRLMAGMWELPQIDALPIKRVSFAGRGHENGVAPLFTTKHSITVTDYRVHVWQAQGPKNGGGKWVPVSRLKMLPLTGLARKILRKAQVI
jgi:A/G-specific adenine glycosylase